MMAFDASGALKGGGSLRYNRRVIGARLEYSLVSGTFKSNLASDREPFVFIGYRLG